MTGFMQDALSKHAEKNWLFYFVSSFESCHVLYCNKIYIILL